VTAELAREGIEPARLIEAGLMKPAEEGLPARDMFFERVMFPIRDRRGRVISFGGRTLGDGKPKYLNGPETQVFLKRRTLYGLDLARAAARTGDRVVVVEGYMDVIALHQAGFGGAVAPLGTALTDEQLQALWQLAPVPVLCFDGDAAGARAAARAAETALPLLTPEHTLEVARLPPGEDPDTLVRAQGQAGFQLVITGARPLANALFDLMREGAGYTTPEERAGLRARLEAAAARIQDRTLASEYRSALLDQFFASRPGRKGPGRKGTSGPFPGTAPRPASPQARPVPAADLVAAERARNLCAILLRHPGLLSDVDEAFGAVELPEWLNRLRDGMYQWADDADVLDSAALMTHLTRTGLGVEAAQALAALPMPLPSCAAPDAMPAEAEAGWWHIFGLMHRGRLEDEVAAAGRDFAAKGDDAAQRRLLALCAARAALQRGEPEGGETDGSGHD
jgi:DNA primase